MNKEKMRKECNLLYPKQWKSLFHAMKGKKFSALNAVFAKALNLAAKEWLTMLLYVAIDKNDKIGPGTLHFSTFPGLTCNQGAFCFLEEGCYDIPIVRRCFEVFRARLRNTWLLRNHPDFVAEALEDAAHRMKAFRAYAGGDVENVEQAMVFVDFANRHPEIPCWTYTKRYDVWNQVPDLGRLMVRYSADKYLGMDNPHGRPLALVDPVKTNCPNQLRGMTCDKCLLCAKSKMAITFKAHGAGRGKFK